MEIKLFDIELENLTVGRNYKGLAIKEVNVGGKKVKLEMEFVVRDGEMVERKIKYFPEESLDKFELTFEIMQLIDEVCRILEIEKGGG